VDDGDKRAPGGQRAGSLRISALFASIEHGAAATGYESRIETRPGGHVRLGKRMARRRRWTAFGIACVAGCAGSNAPSDEAGPGQVEAPVCSSADGTLGATPLRRLTRFEYGRTLADLLGVPTTLADELPPDEKSLGFDGMADTYSVSTLHATKYLEVASSAASSLLASSARLQSFAGCDPTASADCVDPFISAFGRRVYRRTLTEDERAAMLALYATTSTESATDGISAVVTAMLEAPQFLYRAEPSAPDAAFGPALATRLSYLLTASTPDAELLDAAESGELETSDGLLKQADRLLETERAREAFSHFVFEWWDLERLPVIQKDTALFRTWDTTLPTRLGLETQAFLDAAWKATPSLEVFLGAPYTYVDSALATFYGLSQPSGTGFQRVELGPTRAAGLLTQGSFLAVQAKANQTSPILRGKFVRDRLFCDPPEPPPPDLVVSAPTVDPRLSTRERFAQHTANPECSGCHASMDPIGFAFEHYDPVGRWRDTDAGKPVDSSGSLVGTDVDGDVDGVPALAERLLASDEVRTCVATQWFRYAFGRDATTSADACTVGALVSELSRSKGNLRSVMRATVAQELFREQRPEEVAP